MLYSKYVDNEHVGYIEGDYCIHDKIGDYVVTEIIIPRKKEAEIYLQHKDVYLKDSIIVYVGTQFITVAELDEILRPLGFEIIVSKKDLTYVKSFDILVL